MLDLYEKFLRSRSTPSLALIEDIHVVCGCLKLFLRSLEEPLVTYLQRPNFVGASEQYLTNPTKAYDCVLNVLKNLPTPNRHTLSFIMLHLKVKFISVFLNFSIDFLKVSYHFT